MQQRLEFHEREAERDRNHEYRMAQLFLMYNRNNNPQNQLCERSAGDSSSMYPVWGVDQPQMGSLQIPRTLTQDYSMLQCSPRQTDVQSRSTEIPLVQKLVVLRHFPAMIRINWPMRLLTMMTHPHF